MKITHLLRHILIIALLAVALPAASQEEEHYTKEVGVTLGTNFLLSDASHTPYAHSNISGGALLRFILNPRMAVKTMLTYNHINGTTVGADDFFPAHPGETSAERLAKAYRGGITDLSATYELHFLPYGYKRGYQNYRRWTPFIQMGLGLTYSDAGKAFTVNVPLGVGVKWKVGPRLNMALDWAMHLSLSDRLDNVGAPKTIKTEMFRGKDHYGLTMLTLTYDFSKKCPACQKAER